MARYMTFYDTVRYYESCCPSLRNYVSVVPVTETSHGVCLQRHASGRCRRYGQALHMSITWQEATLVLLLSSNWYTSQRWLIEVQRGSRQTIDGCWLPGMYVAFILPLVSVFSAGFCSKFYVLLIVTLINAAATRGDASRKPQNWKKENRNEYTKEDKQAEPKASVIQDKDTSPQCHSLVKRQQNFRITKLLME